MDSSPGGAGYAAHIASIRTSHITVIFAVLHPPHIHAAHDAAGIVFFSCHKAGVYTSEQYGPGLHPNIQRVVSRLIPIILRVVLQVYSQRAGNPGHIDIPLYGPLIPRGGEPPGGLTLDLLPIRDILEAVL